MPPPPPPSPPPPTPSDPAPEPAQQPGPATERLAPGVEVPAAALRFSTSRSGGPGGQNVNKVETRVELRVRLADLPIPPGARSRLARLGGKRVVGEVETIEPDEPAPSTGDGPAPVRRIDHRELIIVADEHRSQKRNRDAAVERLGEMVREALVKPKPRKKTRPSRAAVQRRIDEKKARGETKRRRRRIDE